VGRASVRPTLNLNSAFIEHRVGAAAFLRSCRRSSSLSRSLHGSRTSAIDEIGRRIDDIREGINRRLDWIEARLAGIEALLHLAGAPIVRRS
jgi:hypothetical protein